MWQPSNSMYTSILIFGSTIEQREPTVKVVNENILLQKPVIVDVNTVKNKLKKLNSV